MDEKINKKPVEDAEESEDSAKIYNFPTIITGGKDGGDGPWLTNLPVGTIFLVKAKNLKDRGIAYGQFELVKNLDNEAILLFNGIDKIVGWYDPIRFSNAFEIVKIIGETIEEEEEEFEDDSNRPD